MEERNESLAVLYIRRERERERERERYEANIGAIAGDGARRRTDERPTDRPTERSNVVKVRSVAAIYLFFGGGRGRGGQRLFVPNTNHIHHPDEEEGLSLSAL